MKPSWLATIFIVLLFMSSINMSKAWYQPGYPYTPYYSPYAYYPYGSGRAPWYYRPYQHVYGPSWVVRGRINRYGDYDIRVKLRGVNVSDMYNGWVLYQLYNSGYFE